jgi:hypothetical protein
MVLRHCHNSAEEQDRDEQIEENAQGKGGQAVDRKAWQVHRLGGIEAGLPQATDDRHFARFRSQHRARKKHRQHAKDLAAAIGEILAPLLH